jgi:hypothetical protein
MDNETPNNNENRRPEDEQSTPDDTQSNGAQQSQNPDPAQQQKPEAMASEEKKGGSATMIILLVVLILVIIGIYLFNRSNDSAITDDVTPEEYSEVEETNNQPPVSESDDLSSIEADLEATNFAGVESDAQAMEQ